MRNENDRNQYKTDASAEENILKQKRTSADSTNNAKQCVPDIQQAEWISIRHSILEERLSARFKSIHSINELYRDVTSSDN